MSDEKASVAIEANTEKLATGMKEAESVVEKGAQSITNSISNMGQQTSALIKQMQDTLSGHFGAIGSAFGKVNAVFAAAAGVLAGGAAFKKAIGETTAWNGEVMKLAATLNISTNEASGLLVALDHIGVSGEAFSGAVKGMTRSLGSNEKAFNDLGVQTRDANHNYRSMTDIMGDVNKRLAEIQGGTDREIAGKKLYGRSWDEVRKVIKLTAETMEEGKKRAHELGLEVGPEAAAVTANYNMQKRELGTTMKALSKVIGDALLPLLAKMGEWFNGIGPTAVTAFKVAVNAVVIVIESVIGVFNFLLEVAKNVILHIGIGFMTLGQVIGKALQGDFSGARDAWKDGLKDMELATKMTSERMEEDAKASGKRMKKLLGMGPEDKAVDPKQGKRITGDEGGTGSATAKDTSRLSDWKSYLEGKKEADGDYFKDAKASDLAYWETIAKRRDLSKDETKQVRHEIFQIKSQIAHEELAVELQTMKAQSDAALHGSLERIEIAKQAANRIGEAYGSESKEFTAAMGAIAQMEREHDADQRKRADMVASHTRELAMIEIDIEANKISHLKSMGLINDEQEIAALLQIESRKQAVRRAELQDIIAQARAGSLEQIKAMNDLEKAEAQHNQKVIQMNRQAAHTVSSQWGSVYSKMTNDLESAIKAMTKGALTWNNVWKTVTDQMLSGFTAMVKKQIVTHLAAEHTKTAATGAGAAAREGIEVGAHLKSIALTIWASVKKIAIMAYEAAAGAYDALVGIPYVGPVLAPIGAAVAFAAVGAYGAAAASAEGGYDIPAGVNPMVQTHQNEMILPSHLADKIRNMTDGGGSGEVHHHTWNINAMDAKSLKRYVTKNGATFANNIISQNRNFKRGLS
jgi:Phage-related minor tail protein